MAGRGRVPKLPEQRRNAHVPQRGEWQSAPGLGWQHGPIPDAPDGLLEASREAWTTWFQSWFAAHWTPGDVPALRVTIRLLDEVGRGKFQRAGELRMWADTYGVSPKGQQDRRWVRPTPAEATKPKARPATGPYSHLRVVASDSGSGAA
jgi:hypothetical protein